MIRVASTAVRAWVSPDTGQGNGGERAIAFRSRRFGKRVLVWDTETTTRFEQRLLYGFFALYEADVLIREGIFCSDTIAPDDRLVVERYAEELDIEVLGKYEFVESVFYPEIYTLGTLCVGYNLPFDISRLALGVSTGKGRNRRRFMFTLTHRIKWPRVSIERISNRAAFIRFAHKKYPAKWEKPFFAGRFLDLSTLTTALTGDKHSLGSAGRAFEAEIIKSKPKDLGEVTFDSLTYARRDVQATWALYQRLRREYQMHPFASLANERRQPATALAITRLYSSASVGKAYLKLLGFHPLLDLDPRFDLRYFGYASCAYFGGRAEVRVRRTDVPVTLVDFTSMYGTVFQLLNLQRTMSAIRLRPRQCTRDTRELLERLTLEELYKPETWPMLCRLVKVRPNGDILPVRFRLNASEPYSISTTNLTSLEDRWYCLADVVVAKLRGGKCPEIVEALEFVPRGLQKLRTVKFRGEAKIDPRGEIFKTMVEERQKAKNAASDRSDKSLARLEQGIKQLTNSTAYGINFEVNVRPSPVKGPPSGEIYSDIQYRCNDIHDERPGRFCNPILAALVTAGFRLMLAMAECEVALAGGTFAFCDTDSLAIVSGEDCPIDIPCISKLAVKQIVEKFDLLNPYDPQLVKHLLKIEHEKIDNLRCWAISAKRYVLFTISKCRQFEIIKASESGLGGIIGGTDDENTERLAQRIWLWILCDERGPKYGHSPQERDQRLSDFRGPVRRQLPLSQPEIYKKFKHFNSGKTYDDQIKPFGFIQTVVPTITDGEIIQPMAPFDRSLSRSRRLPWVDINTGKPITIDWNGVGLAGAIPVLGMDDFIKLYSTHPEAKAAGPEGLPCRPETRGVLGRLPLLDTVPFRIGKEIDRLDEGEAVSVLDDKPICYPGDIGDPELTTALNILRKSPQNPISTALGMSERRWRDIVQGRAVPHQKRRVRILRLAARVAADPNSI